LAGRGIPNGETNGRTAPPSFRERRQRAAGGSRMIGERTTPLTVRWNDVPISGLTWRRGGQPLVRASWHARRGAPIRSPYPPPPDWGLRCRYRRAVASPSRYGPCAPPLNRSMTRCSLDPASGGLPSGIGEKRSSNEEPKPGLGARTVSLGVAAPVTSIFCSICSLAPMRSVLGMSRFR
jgi:hypothetical protein